MVKSKSTNPSLIAHSLFEPDIIQVKFRDDYKVRIRNDRLIDIKGKAFTSKRALSLLKRVNHGTWMPMHTVGEKKLAQSRKILAKQPGPPPPDLANWYILILPKGLSSFDITPEFNSLDEVEYAMPLRRPMPPPANPKFSSADTDIYGNIITINFDCPMSDPAGKQNQFSYQINLGAAQPFSAAALNRDNSKIDLTISGMPVDSNDMITVNFFGGSVAVAGADGSVLNSFSYEPVNNNILPDFTDTATVPYQRYLYDSAVHNGVDAVYAWTISGGNGEGVNICDIENTWNRNHKDLQNNGGVNTIGNFPPDSFTQQGWHGTPVLGIFGADNTRHGVKGIACNARKYVAEGDVRYPANLAGAITTVTNSDNMHAGDIILIEQQIAGPSVVLDPTTWNDAVHDISQRGLIAVEWDLAVYQAIRDAVGRGFIVVEPAGNGDEDLDDSKYHLLPDIQKPPGWPDWAKWIVKPAHEPFRRENDSGAIMVGAGDNHTRERLSFSNYGERLDVQAWGGGIVSTAGLGGQVHIFWNKGGDDYLYTNDFGGTSGASAIVAGVCASLQGVYKNIYGRPATCGELRDILVRTGTLQGGDTSRNIGPLPNLLTAIRQVGPEAPNIVPQSGDYTIYQNHFIVDARIPSSIRQNADYRDIKIWVTTDASEPGENNPGSRCIWSGNASPLDYSGTFELTDPGSVVVNAAIFMYSRQFGRRIKSLTASCSYSLLAPITGPVNLIATQGTLAAKVRISWDTLAGALSYEIRSGAGDPNTPGGFTYPLASIPAGATTYDDLNADPLGNAGVYWVCAVLPDNVRTLYTGPVYGWIKIPPIDFVINTSVSGTPLIKWERAIFHTAANYQDIVYSILRGDTQLSYDAQEIYRQDAAHFVRYNGQYPAGYYTDSLREFIDTGVVPGHTYYYWVTAAFRPDSADAINTPRGIWHIWPPPPHIQPIGRTISNTHVRRRSHP